MLPTRFAPSPVNLDLLGPVVARDAAASPVNLGLLACDGCNCPQCRCRGGECQHVVTDKPEPAPTRWRRVDHWVQHCTPYGYCVVENHPTWEQVTLEQVK